MILLLLLLLEKCRLAVEAILVPALVGKGCRLEIATAAAAVVVAAATACLAADDAATDEDDDRRDDNDWTEAAVVDGFTTAKVIACVFLFALPCLASLLIVFSFAFCFCFCFCLAVLCLLPFSCVFSLSCSL